MNCGTSVKNSLRSTLHHQKVPREKQIQIDRQIDRQIDKYILFLLSKYILRSLVTKIILTVKMFNKNIKKYRYFTSLLRYMRNKDQFLFYFDIFMCGMSLCRFVPISHLAEIDQLGPVCNSEQDFTLGHCRWSRGWKPGSTRCLKRETTRC